MSHWNDTVIGPKEIISSWFLFHPNWCGYLLLTVSSHLLLFIFQTGISSVLASATFRGMVPFTNLEICLGEAVGTWRGCTGVNQAPLFTRNCHSHVRIVISVRSQSRVSTSFGLLTFFYLFRSVLPSSTSRRGFAV